MKKTVAILSALLLVAVILVGVFVSQKNTISSEKDELSKQVESLNAQVESLTKQGETNKAEADDAKKALEEAQKELDDAKKTAEENDAAVKAAEDEKAKLEADIKDLKAKAEESASTKKSAEEALKETQDKLTASEENAKKLQDKLSASEENAKELQDKLAASEESTKELQSKLAEYDSSIQELNDKLTALEGVKATAEGALSAAQKELKSLKEARGLLDDKMAALVNEKTELQAKLDELNSSAASAETEETSGIIILHTNDVHARVEGNDKDQIGYPRLVSIAKELRKDNQVILLDAGDVLHGTAFANLTQGESIVNLMNLAGYSAMAPGNHDFNYGYEHLMELEKQMNFPLVNANIMKNGENAFAPYAIIEAGTKNIAVIGAANPQMQSAIHPDKIKGLEFKDYDIIEKTVEEVRPHADAVIILAHWGANDAYEPNSSILAKIPGVDLVVDGHSHTPFEAIKQTDNAALVVSAGEHMGEIGCVSMQFAKDGVVCTEDPISFEEAQEYAPDEEAVNLIQKLKDEQQELMSVVIGKTDVLLDGERETNRTGETNLGDLATDALMWYSGADFAFTNGGGIRTSIQAGDITKGNIIEVFPFGNNVVVIEATGEQILAAMEHGLSKYPETNGGFPQISGGKIVYNPQKPAGERIVEMTINDKPVEKDKKYTLVTNDFTAAGGDGYLMLKDCPVIRYQGTLDEAFIDYIKEIGVVNISVEGRIVQEKPLEQDTPEEEKAPETVAEL